MTEYDIGVLDEIFERLDKLEAEDVGPHSKGIIMDRVRELERKTKDLEESIKNGKIIAPGILNAIDKRIHKLEEWRHGIDNVTPLDIDRLMYNPSKSKLIDKKVWEEIKSDINLMAEYLERNYSNTPMATIERNLLRCIKKAEGDKD